MGLWIKCFFRQFQLFSLYSDKDPFLSSGRPAEAIRPEVRGTGSQVMENFSWVCYSSSQGSANSPAAFGGPKQGEGITVGLAFWSSLTLHRDEL